MNMDQIVDVWNEKANAYEPQPGKDYGWVLDYAEFRLQFTFANARYLEDKSMGFLKFVLSIAVATWGIVTFLLNKGLQFDLVGAVLAVLGSVFLAGSALLCLRSFGPSRRPVPLNEEVALRAIDHTESSEHSKAILSLGLAATTEYQSALTSQKGGMLSRGMYWGYAGILLIISSLFWLAFRQTFPTFGPLGG
jgi:hypothetical protein